MAPELRTPKRSPTLTVDIEFTACGTVETGVAGDDVVFGSEVGTDRRQYRDTSASSIPLAK